MLKRSLSFLLTSCLFITTQAQGLEIKELTRDHYVFTTWKSYNGTPFPSNGLYVVTDSGVVLIDTPWDTSQTFPLLDSIQRKHGKKVIFCIATHYHDDRTGGFDQLKSIGIPTFTSYKTWLFSREEKAPLASGIFYHDTVFQAGNTRVETFYPGEGHTADNIVVWFPQSKVLYGGCFIKSTEAGGLGNIADANVEAWPESIRRMLKKYPEPRFVIPGHQGWDNRKSPEHTLKLLDQAIKK